MTRTDAIIQRVRALPAKDQEALAEQIEDGLSEPGLPTPPADEGSIVWELARRGAAWRTNPAGTPAAELHAG